MSKGVVSRLWDFEIGDGFLFCFFSSGLCFRLFINF